MKTIVSMSFLLLAGTAVFAGVPAKKPLTAYLHLSPLFTKAPEAIDPAPRTSVFEDWALGGVSEVEGGYMVTLVHKKNAGETQVIKPRGTVRGSKDEMKWIRPGDPGSFTIERVDFNKESWKDTTVVLSAGGESATIGFDANQLAPTKSAEPAQKLSPGQPGSQTQVRPRLAVAPSGQGQARQLQNPK